MMRGFASRYWSNNRWATPSEPPDLETMLMQHIAFETNPLLQLLGRTYLVNGVNPVYLERHRSAGRGQLSILIS